MVTLMRKNIGNSVLLPSVRHFLAVPVATWQCHRDAMARGSCECIHDRPTLWRCELFPEARYPHRVVCAPSIQPVSDQPLPRTRTEWVLMTSGTTGMPKMVLHDFAGLTAAMRASSPADGAAVWGTFYDIRRYGGLQMYLRAVLGGASLVLSSAGEPIADHLDRLAQHGVTHLSGTPSQWRSALMNPTIRKIAPRYVRLSGEIADQAILDRLRAVFPHA